METVSFYVKEDFKIKIGVEQEEIVIPRIMFKDVNKFFDKVVNILSTDTHATFKVLQESKRLDSLLNVRAFKSFEKAVDEVFPILIKEKNSKELKELMKIISSGVLDDMWFDKMQYAEACEVLRYLVDNNFESLKNLSASLQVMNMSMKSGKES